MNSKKSEVKNQTKNILKNQNLKTKAKINHKGIIKKILKITWNKALFLKSQTWCFSAKVWISSINWNGWNCQVWTAFLLSQNHGEKSGKGNKISPKAKKKKSTKR